MNNLRQAGLALLQMTDTQKRLPPLFNCNDPHPPAGQAKLPAYGGRWGSVFYHLLGYLDEGSLYDLGEPSFDYTTGASKPAGGARKVPGYLCPADATMPTIGTTRGDEKSLGGCNYAANYLVLGNPDVFDEEYPFPAFAGANRYPDSIADGTSTTVLFAEKISACNRTAGTASLRGGNLWAYPPSFPGGTNPYFNYAGILAYVPPSLSALEPTVTWDAMFQSTPPEDQCNPFLSQSAHSKGRMNVCMADSSVLTITNRISPATWRAVLTPRGRDKVGDDWVAAPVE